MDRRDEWMLGEMMVPQPLTLLSLCVPGIGDRITVANQVIAGQAQLLIIEFNPSMKESAI